MIFVLFIFNVTSSFSFPIHLSPIEVDHPYKGPHEWQCFSTSQIKKINCKEWDDNYTDSGKWVERSDLELVIEADTEIHEYGFNTSAYEICAEIKKDFLDVLRAQTHFCIYGTPLGFVDFEFKSLRKPTMSWIYECIKSNRAQVAWHGGFGSCIED